MEIAKVRCLKSDPDSDFTAGKIYSLQEPVENFINKNPNDCIRMQFITILNNKNLGKYVIISNNDENFEIL